MEKEKCKGCEIKRNPEQFIYNGKINTTCIICCEKRKKRYNKSKEPPTEPPKEPPKEPPESKDKLIERKLCLNHEFIYRSFFPVHKYYSQELFVDIRDLFSPSRDKEISYRNCEYFHSSVY